MRLPQRERRIVSDGGDATLLTRRKRSGAATPGHGHRPEHAIVRDQRRKERRADLEILRRSAKSGMLGPIIIGPHRTPLVDGALRERAGERKARAEHRRERSSRAHYVTAFIVESHDGGTA